MATLSAEELQSVLDFTISLARRAGDIIIEGSHAIRGQTVSEKKNAVDLVTEYDVRVEKVVRDELSSKYPAFKFIGEESYAAGEKPTLTDEPTFCVDPIDGTTNFVHGFPYACVSLGLIYRKRPVLGVIYNPFLDQMYTGLKSQGAYLITQTGALKVPLPLHPPSMLPSLQNALIGVEWGSDRSGPVIAKKAESFAKLAGDPNTGVRGGKMAHSLRSLGSAALNYAMVASGGLDLYWEIGCWSWDVCAGIIIAQEAGGYIAGAPGSPFEDNVSEEILFGRKYIVIRAIADSTEESGRDAQKRIIKEFYETVEDWAPN